MIAGLGLSRTWKFETAHRNSPTAAPSRERPIQSDSLHSHQDRTQRLHASSERSKAEIKNW